MQNRTLPLPQLPTLGGGFLRRRRIKDVLLALLGLAIFAILYLAARPRIAPKPIANLDKNGVHGVYTLKNAGGELLLHNFRAIEAGKLYRGSGFPRNHVGVLNGKKGLHPAAALDSTAFDFLRKHNIRVIVTLNDKKDFYAERGYFEYYFRRTDYKIRMVSFITLPDMAYVRGSKADRNFGLKTAVQFIRFMKEQAPADGAVYLHDDSGKDAVGVVAAVYELWRNTGTLPREELWQQVLARYMVSDTLIKRDKDTKKFSGNPIQCKDGTKSYVCPDLLESLRPDMERIAQMN